MRPGSTASRQRRPSAGEQPAPPHSDLATSASSIGASDVVSGPRAKAGLTSTSGLKDPTIVRNFGSWLPAAKRLSIR